MLFFKCGNDSITYFLKQTIRKHRPPVLAKNQGVWCRIKSSFLKFYTNPIRWVRQAMVVDEDRTIVWGCFMLLKSFVLLVFSFISCAEISFLLIVSMLFALLLIVHKCWLPYQHRLFPLFWFFVVFFCIPLTSLLVFWYCQDTYCKIQELFVTLVFLFATVGCMVAPIISLCTVAVAMLFIGVEDSCLLNTNIGNSVYYTLAQYVFFAGIISVLFHGNARQKIHRRLVIKALNNEFCHDVGKNGIAYLAKSLQEKCHIHFDVTFLKEDYEKILLCTSRIQDRYTNMRNILRTFEKMVDNNGVDFRDIKVVDMHSLTCYMQGMLPLTHKYQAEVVASNRGNFNVAVVPDLFYIVLQNLLKNAIAHRNADKIEVSFLPKHRALEIADNGAVISKEDQKHIWSATSALANKGNVLLAFSKILLDLFHVHISCSSQNGKTIFRMVFPEVFI